MQYVRCNLCGQDNFVNLFRAHSYSLYSGEEFSIVQCRECGLVFINPRPEKEEIDKYYSAEYFQEVNEPSLLKKCFKLDRGRLVNNLKVKGRLLDVGCGRGEFLKQMEGLGWEVWGVDSSPIACEYARARMGLSRIFNQDLLDFNMTETYFDVITLWHSLEHLTIPLSTLEKIRKILKQDGVLIIACPNFSGYVSKLFKEKWYALSPPVHLYQFSPHTLKKLLETAGFRVSKLNYGADLLEDTVSFKLSLLYWLNRKVLLSRGRGGISVNKAGFPRIFWIVGRMLLNIFCLLVSSVLSFLNKGDSILCLCKVAKITDESS